MALFLISCNCSSHSRLLSLKCVNLFRKLIAILVWGFLMQSLLECPADQKHMIEDLRLHIILLQSEKEESMALRWRQGF